MRIKGVKTLYFSGAGTFSQFSTGHRNLLASLRQSLFTFKYSNKCLRLASEKFL